MKIFLLLLFSFSSVLKAEWCGELSSQERPLECLTGKNENHYDQAGNPVISFYRELIPYTCKEFNCKDCNFQEVENKCAEKGGFLFLYDGRGNPNPTGLKLAS